MRPHLVVVGEEPVDLALQVADRAGLVPLGDSSRRSEGLRRHFG
jgi:hypothetical protein